MKTAAIALNTFREAIRNKVLYSILFFTFFTVALAAIIGTASIGDHMKFIKDFSLMSISLFGVITAIVLGVNMLNNELRKRTIFNVLSKPVARWQFIVGKFFGLLTTLTIVMALMCSILVGLFVLLEHRVDWGLVLASGAALLELSVIVAVALFFSSVVVTPTLAGLFTISVFIAGRSAGYLSYFSEQDFPPALRGITQGLYWVLPHLYRFNIADRVIYAIEVDPAYFVALVAYATAYCTVLLLLSVALFSRREFV